MNLRKGFIFSPKICSRFDTLYRIRQKIHSQLEGCLYCIEQLVDSLDEKQLEEILPVLLQSLSKFIQQPNPEQSKTTTTALACLSAIFTAAGESIEPQLQERQPVLLRLS